MDGWILTHPGLKTKETNKKVSYNFSIFVNYKRVIGMKCNLIKFIHNKKKQLFIKATDSFVVDPKKSMYN